VGIESLVDQPLLFFLEFKKKLALSLGRTDFHQAPVIHDELENIGFDPERGVIGKFNILVGIKLLHRLHQPDVAFLNEIQKILHPYPLKFQGDFNHQPEIGRSQNIGGIRIVFFLNTFTEFDFLIPREQSVAADFRKISLKRVVFNNTSFRIT